MDFKELFNISADDLIKKEAEYFLNGLETRKSMSIEEMRIANSDDPLAAAIDYVSGIRRESIEESIKMQQLITDRMPVIPELPKV